MLSIVLSLLVVKNKWRKNKERSLLLRYVPYQLFHYLFNSCFRNSTRIIFPEAVLGSSSVNSILRGYL